MLIFLEANISHKHFDSEIWSRNS